MIVRDMAGDASQQAANKLRPSEEQLAQVDQPAEENTWHEKPDKEQLKSKFKKNKSVSFILPQRAQHSCCEMWNRILTLRKGSCERSFRC